MCRIDEKIALLYKVIAAPFSQLSCMLYPRVMVISNMNNMSDDNFWGFLDETSHLIVKPYTISCKYQKQLTGDLLLIDDSEYITLLVGSQF